MKEITHAGVLKIRTVDDLSRISAMMAKSGYFRDAKDAAQIGVKILAGQGWGIQPFDAITGIHVIQGKPAIGAGLMAAKVKGSGKYDYRVRETSDTNCSIEFYQWDGNAWESIGMSNFSLEDAKKAGTQNLSKFPRNMLFARAMSNGVKWYTPDVFTSPVYAPEELGADVDEDGDIVDTVSTIREVSVPQNKESETQDEAPLTSEAQETEPEPDADAVTPAQVRVIAIALRETELERDAGREFVSYVIGRGVDSVKDLTKTEASDFLEAIADEDAERFAVDAAKLAELLNGFREFTGG